MLTLRPDVEEAGLAGGHDVRLLQGGDELFPAMIEAIGRAQRSVWLATYIFHDDESAQAVARALREAGARGVRVAVVVDGFGSKATLARLRDWLAEPEVALTVFRPVDSWWSLLQPGQLRRLHQKLCVVDDEIGFVGGINVIDDRNDLRLGRAELPRLDFAVAVRGPLVAAVEQAASAIWRRAQFGIEWRDEMRTLARSTEPLAQARRMLRGLRMSPGALPAPTMQPMRAAFLVRDNLRRRRSIEQAYIRAILRAQGAVDIICPYFYPGRVFRHALRTAARRGVRVRLLLQGKIDYRFAALAAQVLYDEMLADGVRIFEYTPAFLHAKVALVDEDWATVGSSNIDPLSLLLNLEANVIVRDAGFSAELRQRFEAAVAVSREVTAPPAGQGGWAVLRRAAVAWAAHWALRMAGLSGRY